MEDIKEKTDKQKIQAIDELITKAHMGLTFKVRDTLNEESEDLFNYYTAMILEAMQIVNEKVIECPICGQKFLSTSGMGVCSSECADKFY